MADALPLGFVGVDGACGGVLGVLLGVVGVLGNAVGVRGVRGVRGDLVAYLLALSTNIFAQIGSIFLTFCLFKVVGVFWPYLALFVCFFGSCGLSKSFHSASVSLG